MCKHLYSFDHLGKAGCAACLICFLNCCQALMYTQKSKNLLQGILKKKLFRLANVHIKLYNPCLPVVGG